jgi:hypothetical protein
MFIDKAVKHLGVCKFSKSINPLHAKKRKTKKKEKIKKKERKKEKKNK